jgi:hypothetical protein
MYLYLATNRKNPVRITSKIGCASCVVERLTLLNGVAPAPGAERRSRHAPGAWKLLLVIAVPPTLSGRALSEQWSRDARKIHCRFQYGIELAWHFCLPYFIDFEELLADTALVAAIPEFVTSVRACALRGTLDDEAARVLFEETSRPPTTTFRGMSFAPADRPHARYRKRKASTPKATLATPTMISASELDVLLRGALDA